MVPLQRVCLPLVLEHPLAEREKPGAGPARPCRVMRGLAPSPARVWVAVLNWAVVFRGVFIAGVINRVNDVQMQQFKKKKIPGMQQSLLHIWGRGSLSPIPRPRCRCVPHGFSPPDGPRVVLEQHGSCWSQHEGGHLALAGAFSVSSRFCPFVLLASSFLLCFLE